MKKIIYISILLLVASITSCERALIAPDAYGEPGDVYDELWTRLNERYSFFEYKKINWDSLYLVYRYQITEETSEVELFDICSALLYELRDGHVNLTSPFDVSRNWQWYLNSPQNFDFETLERNYWGENYRITGPFRNMVLRDSVVYVYYSSFSNLYSDGQIDAILKSASSYKGLIFDIRDNGGGFIMNASDLAGKFIKKDQVLGYTRTKLDTTAGAFGPMQSISIEADQEVYFNKPVILLTNRSSYSAANLFTTFMSALPQVTIIGDTTGGGGGLPITYQLSNGWRVRYSSTQTFDIDGYNVEHGVAPDTVVNISASHIANGVDPILEAAIHRILLR